MIEDTVPPQYAPQPARRPISLGKIIAGLVGALALGTVLTLQVRGWGSVINETGGSCGGRSRPSCPQGSVTTVVLSLFALFPLVPLVGVIFFAQWRRRDLPGRTAAAVIVLMIPLGIPPGMAIFNWAHGTTLTTAWTAPREADARLSGQGSWSVPGAIVRARQDHLVAYDLATGHIRFTYTIPDPQLLCAMSRTVEGGIGLLAYGPEGGACQHVVALDLTSGRPLWQKDLSNQSLAGSNQKDFLALAGDLAIVRAPGVTNPELSSNQGIQALDLRTGAMRWHTELSGTCTFQSIGGQVTAVVQCVNVLQPGRVLPLSSAISYSFRTYDPATGHQRTSTSLPSGSQTPNITVLSYSPLVIHLAQSSTRGSDKVYVLGDDGHIQATIVSGGVGAPVTLDLSAETNFEVLPVANYAIAQGILVAKARLPLTAKAALEAFSLRDGHLLWSHSLGYNSLEAITAEGDQALTLTESGFNDTITSYRLRDGSQHQAGRVQLDLLTAQTALFAQGKTYAIVDANGNTYPPVAVLK